MLFVNPNNDQNINVEKGLGSFKQAIKLKHKGGKGKKRKNMPGYHQAFDKLGRSYWAPNNTVEKTYQGDTGKKSYIEMHAKPGDVIKHEDSNYVVLGRLGHQLVVLDPENSHIKLSTLSKEQDVVVREHLPELFTQDPVLLQRKIIGRYMSVKDILEHPDNHYQSKDLHDKGLLKLPDGMKLSDTPNTEFAKKEAAAVQNNKKTKGEKDVESKAKTLTAVDLDNPPEGATRFQPGETFKMKDYIHTLKLGDKILTSKDTHWTVVGKGLVDEKIRNEQGEWINTGSKKPVVLVASDKIDGVYALQLDGNNRTYTMVSHGDNDEAHQVPHLQKAIIVKSKNQGYDLRQLLDGSYVIIPEKFAGVQNPGVTYTTAGKPTGVVSITPPKQPPTSNNKKPNYISTPPKASKVTVKPDLDLADSEHADMATLKYAKNLFDNTGKNKVSFIVHDGDGKYRRITATRGEQGPKISLQARPIGSKPKASDKKKDRKLTLNMKGNYRTHASNDKKGLLDSLIGAVEENNKDGRL